MMHAEDSIGQDRPEANVEGLKYPSGRLICMLS